MVERLRKKYKEAKAVREAILKNNTALVYIGWRLTSPYLPNIDLNFWNTNINRPYTYTV